jgi:hypothetical protein
MDREMEMFIYLLRVDHFNALSTRFFDEMNALHYPKNNDQVFVLRKKPTFLDLFWCTESDSVFRCFPARQALEIILYIFSQNTENSLNYTWFLWF